MLSAIITTIYPQNSFSSYKAETLYPWNKNSPASLPIDLAITVQLPASMIADYSKHLEISKIMLGFFFFQSGLFPLSIMFSGLSIYSMCQNFLPKDD